MDNKVESKDDASQDSDKPTYMIRPNFHHKFKKATVKECIHTVLVKTLQGKQYDPEEIPEWTQTITNGIKNELKEIKGVDLEKPSYREGMEFDRYKFVVQCVIGEQRGQDVKMSCRCFWDSDTDNYAQDVFTNNSIFCVAAAFGVFFY